MYYCLKVYGMIVLFKKVNTCLLPYGHSCVSDIDCTNNLMCLSNGTCSCPNVIFNIFVHENSKIVHNRIKTFNLFK